MRTQGWLGAAFITSLLLLGMVIAWVLARFSMPGSKIIDIGPLSDYPPSSQPYEVQNPVHVFVVNDGGQVIVLDPLNHVPGGYKVQWYAQDRIFIDPSRGTWFDILGRPVRHRTIYDLVEQQGLMRYPVQIRAGRVMVDISHRNSP